MRFFLIFSVLAYWFAGSAVAQIPAEILYRDDRVADVAMSPDGGRIAVLLNGYDEAVDEVRIIDLESLTVSKTVSLDEFEGYSIRWANSQRLILAVNVMDTYKDELNGRFTDVEYVAGRRALSLNVETGIPTVMFEGENDFVQRNRNLGRIVSTLHEDPDHIIMPAWDINGYHLWKVNVNTGAAAISDRGNDKTVLWYTDRDGRGVIRMDASSSFRTLYVYGRQPDGEWKRLRKIRIDDQEEDNLSDFRPVAPGPENGQYYVISYPEDEEYRTVKLYGISTDSFIKTVYKGEQTDIHDVVLDIKTGELIGIQTARDRLETVIFDSNVQSHINGLDNYFKNESNFSIIGNSQDGRFAVIYVSSPTNSGEYYVYDFENANLQFLFPKRDGINADQLGKMTMETYPSTDGTELQAYVTHPPGVAKNAFAPLIMLVHGGPESRDYYDFDRRVQYFASRGYRVVQPYFRGSSGRGRTFAEAGYQQWGGLMQNDVTDALKYWQSNGLADPERTCIMGGSYGGYAALYAGATTPELVSCVISINGASDLVSLMAHDRERYGFDSETYAYWVKSIGNPRNEKSKLRELSPSNMAERFEDPIFLAHGERDVIVPVDQSERMEKALKRAGKTYQYHEYELEGHRYWEWHNYVDLYKRICAFVSQNVQPPAE